MYRIFGENYIFFNIILKSFLHIIIYLCPISIWIIYDRVLSNFSISNDNQSNQIFTRFIQNFIVKMTSYKKRKERAYLA